MKPSRETLVPAAAWLAAVAMAVLAVTGGVRYFNMVPHWDMWHGYLHFYTLIREGSFHTFWELHNEHRIVLARILFWIDMAWFDGRQWFLIAMNYLLVLGAFFTWRSILRERAGDQADGKPLQVVVLLVFCALFSWVQAENLSWAFQSQFILAQWLPLLALYLLYRSRGNTALTERNFMLAVGVGVLCMGTMASGILALPVMAAYALLERMGWRRAGLLGGLATVLIALYFTGYQTPQGHGDLGEVGKLEIRRLVQYVFVYLGSPFFHLLGERSLPLAQLFGFVLLALAAWRAVQALRAPRQHHFELFVLAYLACLVGTALGTGAGRLVFGLHQATASRYTTPALMAWIAVLALYLPALLRALAGWRQRVLWPPAALVATLLAYQTRAAEPQHARLFERDLAALGVVMGVMDEKQVRHSYFSMYWAQGIYNRMPDKTKAVFGLPQFHDAKTAVGQRLAQMPAGRCHAVYSELTAVDKEPRWLSVMGWIGLADGKPGNEITAVRLVAADGLVVGYALAGANMEHPLHNTGQGYNARPFKGYMLPQYAHVPLTLVPSGADCSVPMQALRDQPVTTEAAAAASR